MRVARTEGVAAIGTRLQTDGADQSLATCAGSKSAEHARALAAVVARERTVLADGMPFKFARHLTIRAGYVLTVRAVAHGTENAGPLAAALTDERAIGTDEMAARAILQLHARAALVAVGAVLWSGHGLFEITRWGRCRRDLRGRSGGCIFGRHLQPLFERRRAHGLFRD